MNVLLLKSEENMAPKEWPCITGPLCSETHPPCAHTYKHMHTCNPV